MNTTGKSGITVTELSPGKFLELIKEGNRIHTNDGADGLISHIDNNTFKIEIAVAVLGTKDNPSCELDKEKNCFLDVRTTRTAVLLCIDQDGDVTTIYPEIAW